MPLAEASVPVNNAALIVGGGIAGMTAALAIAEQGFPVHLVEKSSELGGTVRQLHETLDGEDIRLFLNRTVERIEEHPKIHVHLDTTAVKVEGHVGGFTSALRTNHDSVSVKHGVIVVATGATEQKPQSYGYGQSPHVMTQLELTDQLHQGTLGEGDGRDDPVRRTAERRATVLQPHLLHDRRQECVALARSIPPSQDRGPLSRHADLRLPRGGLPRGP
jgi:heterodisulfide reductase subunit A-like polyferredoxin